MADTITTTCHICGEENDCISFEDGMTCEDCYLEQRPKSFIAHDNISKLLELLNSHGFGESTLLVT